MSLQDSLDARRADRRFIRHAMRQPMLAAEHELDLARRWREERDERALHELTAAYMRLVISMAGRFRNYGLPMGDLVQEGSVGLMQAAARFEPERAVRFSTYAAWWIRSSIQDYVLRNWSIVRTGTTAAQKSLFFNLRRLRAMLSDLGDGRLKPEHRAFIAKELAVEEPEVEAMASRMAVSDRSLNAPLATDGELEWQDLVVAEDATPEQAVMDARDGASRTSLLQDALATLNPRELVIVRERRLAEEPVTLETLGRRLGVSKERVRQIEHVALEKLKRAVEARLPPGVNLLESGLVG